MTTHTNYRAALEELIDAVDRLLGQGESPANPGSRLILTVHVEDLGAIADRARTLLAAAEVVDPVAEFVSQCKPLTPEAAEVLTPENRWRLFGDAAPEAVGVTDEDLRGIFCRHSDSGENGPAWIECEEFIVAARAVLSRYGTAHPAPVPVGERLPGVEDMDSEGTCWCWHSVMYTWGLFRFDPTAHSHWLPHWALPLPGVEA
jgi:hypothetical protein